MCFNCIQMKRSLISAGLAVCGYFSPLPLLNPKESEQITLVIKPSLPDPLWAKLRSDTFDNRREKTKDPLLKTEPVPWLIRNKLPLCLAPTNLYRFKVKQVYKPSLSRK